MQKGVIAGIVAVIVLMIAGYFFFASQEKESVVEAEALSGEVMDDSVMDEAVAESLDESMDEFMDDEADAFSVVDEGDFVLTIAPATSDDTVRYQEYMEESGDFEPIVADLNESYALPYDVAITFTNCDEANAYYEEETKSLTYCYELMQDVDRIYTEQGMDEEDASLALYNNTLATLFHEMGHAMIDIQEIPITGREEDVADQISTYILLETYEESAEAVLDAAQEYYVNAGDAELDESSYADTHTLDLARYFNLVCWVYGSDEVAFETLPEDSGLPAERAERCSDEYAQFKESLDILFADFTKA